MELSTLRRYGWIIGFIRSNPLVSLWTLLVFVGGCILLAHQANEGYLPEFTLTDLVGLIASITLIGMFLVAFMVVGCVLPTIGLRWVEKAWPLAGRQRYFAQPAARWVIGLFPVCVYAVFYLAIIVANAYAYAIHTWAYLAVVLFFSTVLAAVLVRHEEGSHLLPSLAKESCFLRAFALFFWTLLFAIPLQITWMFGAAGDPQYDIWITSAFTVFFIFFNWTAYLAKARDFKYIVAIILVVIMVLIPLFGNNSIFFPKMILQLLALGNRNATELVVSNRQCPALARYNVRCDSSLENHAVVLENVNVISRVGSTMLIELMVQQGSPAPPNMLTVAPSRRRLYCGPDAATGKVCASCDELVLTHAESYDAYAARLVCIRLAIPKDQVLTTNYGGERRYSGFTRIHSDR